MEYIVLSFSVLSFLVSLIVLIFVIKKKGSGNAILTDENLKKIRDSINEATHNSEERVSALVAEKNNTLMLDLRKDVDDISKSIDELIKSQKELNSFSTKTKEETLKLLNDNSNVTNKIITDFIKQYTDGSNKQKEEIMTKLSLEMQKFNEAVKKTISDFDASMKEKLEDFKKNTNESIKSLNETVTKSLTEIRKDNNEKLDKINESVNEKLQKTLEEKLKDSFKSVVEGIGDVNKAVGEIKGLASDVGSLKSVLTNVKTKGILGEVILGNIIKEVLTTAQYDENVVTKPGSSERVEFAIKLPGQRGETIYLPVDSKFPYEPYNSIHEASNPEDIEAARKKLRTDLLKYAKDVHDKYIDVPNTTDFAIIFLPLEGLYLEALNMGLFEEIQSKYSVNLTGPTTFTAFVSALNMGFKSLMIEKKSAELKELLGVVKTEFGRFTDALEKTQYKVNKAAEELDNLVGRRTKMMNSKLKSIDLVDDATVKRIMGDSFDDTDKEES